MKINYAPGDECIVTGVMGMIPEAREFIGKKCIIIKKTRAGLFQVSLADNPKLIYSFPKYSLCPLPWYGS